MQNGKKLILKPKSHYRPSIHLLIDFKGPKRWRTRDEVIFSDHKRIKYAHDITRFTTQKVNYADKCLRIFVVALKAQTKYSEGIQELIYLDLKSVRIIPKPQIWSIPTGLTFTCQNTLLMTSKKLPYF